MTRNQINGTDIHYEIEGDGPPLVLVHGSWVDQRDWRLVIGPLAETFRVISYDRRGHSRSADTPQDEPRTVDEDDLATIIESLAGGSAHLVANSFGGLISLGLTARRPELVRSLAVHEAPCMSLADEGPELALLNRAFEAVLAQIAAGDAEGGTRRFMEEVALGPGSWEMLSEMERRIFVANAPTFVGEALDPEGTALDTDALAVSARPTLVTKGTEGPEHLQLLADALARELPHAESVAIEGAGHAPHETHPREFVELIAEFAMEHERSAAQWPSLA